MGKMTADELRRAGEAYRSENNGSQKSPVTVSANTEGSSKKMTASELRQAGEAYRKANGLSDPIYRESPATVVDKYSAPSTQPTQAAPAGASSSENRKKELETKIAELERAQKEYQRIPSSVKLQYGLASKEEILAEQDNMRNAEKDLINAKRELKELQAQEKTKGYDPKNRSAIGKAADLIASGVTSITQAVGDASAIIHSASPYDSANSKYRAEQAAQYMRSGMSYEDAREKAGLNRKANIAFTDYDTAAEIRNSENIKNSPAIEAFLLEGGTSISNMAIPALLSKFGGPIGQVLGLGMMWTQSFSSKFRDSYQKYGDANKALDVAFLSAAASTVIEQFGGVFGNAKLANTAKQIVAKDAPALFSLATSPVGKLIFTGISEGLEEGAEDVVNYAIEKALTGESDELDRVGYDMLLGAFSGGFIGSGSAIAKTAYYNHVGKSVNASPETVSEQIKKGLEAGKGTEPYIYATEAQKKPSNQVVGRLYEANAKFDAETGLSKLSSGTQTLKDMIAIAHDAEALVKAANKLGTNADPNEVIAAATEKQKAASTEAAKLRVEGAFVQTVDSPSNVAEQSFNNAIAGSAANQTISYQIYKDPAARASFSRLTGLKFTGDQAVDVAAIQVTTRKIAEQSAGKTAISAGEMAARKQAAADAAAAKYDADLAAQAQQMQEESNARWLSLQQNTVIDIDGKRHLKEITNTDVRGNTEIGYKKAEITKSKKKAADAVNNAAKYLGKNIVWFEGAVQVNGQYRLTNGYRAPDGTIYVNINSRDPLMVTFGHEMFHDLVADSKYSGLINTLVENPDYADMVNGMMNAKTELYERNGIELDPNEAAEEVAADISGDLLGSRDMLEYIGARNEEAATGIKGFLNRILKKLKGKPSAQEAYNRLSESQKALLNGMEGRTESTNSAEDASGKYSIIDISAMDSEYFAAVESGNMHEAQRLVDEAAKAAGAILAFRSTLHPIKQSLLRFGQPVIGFLCRGLSF